MPATRWLIGAIPALVLLLVAAAASAQQESACGSDLDCPSGEVCELAGPGCDTPVCVSGCHDDAQCGEGRSCSQVACVSCPCPGVCVELPPDAACRNDADCRVGEVCELGGPECATPVCVPGCHEDAQCGEDATCADVDCVTCPCPGLCVGLGPEPECRADADCEKGEVCELGGADCATPVCVPGCHEDAQCEGEERCLEVQCVTCPCPGLCSDPGPGPACRLDSDCGPGEVCEDGGPGCATPVCVEGCHEKSQCDEGQICQQVACVTCPCPGICIDLDPDPECERDADCGAGRVCDLGGASCRRPVCVTGCHEDEQCGEGEVCRQVHCITCPCPGQCDEAPPEPGCRGDDDCEPGAVCEPAGPGCAVARCVEGCHERAQCKDGQVCRPNICVTCPCPGSCADAIAPCGGGLRPGDANGDGGVDGSDYTIWADHFGQAEVGFERGDFDCDGFVTGGDYTLWSDNFGPAPPALAGAGAGAEAGARVACGLGFELALALLPIALAGRRRGPR